MAYQTITEEQIRQFLNTSENAMVIEVARTAENMSVLNASVDGFAESYEKFGFETFQLFGAPRFVGEGSRRLAIKLVEVNAYD